MALYGNNLAKAVRPGASKADLAAICQAAHDALQLSEDSFSAWDNFTTNGAIDEINREVLVLLDPSMVEQARALWADSFGLWSKTSAYVDASNDPPTANLVDAVGILASNASGVVHTIDSLFHTAVASQLSDAIVAEAGDLSDKLANGVSKILGNAIGGLWWVIALALGALYVWHKYGINRRLVS